MSGSTIKNLSALLKYILKISKYIFGDISKYLADILYGFIQRDYEKVADVHFKAGLVPADESKESFSQALRSIGEPIFGQSIKNISA